MTPSELYPTDTVTVVFTDIEGYSILEGQYGSALQPVLDEHNHLLREALLRQNGMEVRIVGDAFFITFAKPSDAVQFAVDAQHRLVEHQWSVSPSQDGEATTITLRVRMGMHTGEARVLRHPTGQIDYFGTTVNLAARIGAAGHGGQILVSEATRLLAVPQLPSDIDFEDLGLHRLKGVGGGAHLAGVPLRPAV
jgi:class 3 adenylate cyclase